MSERATKRPNLLRLLARGITKRCARCGHGRLFRRWIRMLPACPQCGLRFEREEGGWLGGVVVNMGVTQTFVIAVLVASIFLARDVPLPTLLTVDALLIGAFAFWFFPYSKTIWLAVELWLRAEREDRADVDVPRYLRPGR